MQNTNKKMIPSHFKPKYKSLVRLRSDVWHTLKTKTLKKKKWRFLVGILKRKRRKTPRFLNYALKSLPKYPVYRRYRHQKELFLRQSIKLIYGSLQNEKIKQYAKYSKIKAWPGFLTKLEQKVTVFLYRSKLTSTLGEAKVHFMHKRLLVNGSYKTLYIKGGDVLHFSPALEKLLKRRSYNLFLTYKKRRKKKKKTFILLHNCVDFDVSSFRFYFLSNIYYQKNHPFFIPFQRVWRWYTRV